MRLRGGCAPDGRVQPSGESMHVGCREKSTMRTSSSDRFADSATTPPPPPPEFRAGSRGSQELLVKRFRREAGGSCDEELGKLERESMGSRRKD